MPHLPFEDRKFGFVFAGSVFSHIDDLADAWLAGQFDVFTVGRSASSFVFYDLDYLKKSIEPMFRVLSVTGEVRLYQNALVLERV